MQQKMARLVVEEEGQDLIEYALLTALLAITVLTAALQLSRIREFFAAAGAVLDAAI